MVLASLGVGLAFGLVAAYVEWALAEVRVKDVARVNGAPDNSLFGYGLVIGRTAPVTATLDVGVGLADPLIRDLARKKSSSLGPDRPMANRQQPPTEHRSTP